MEETRTVIKFKKWFFRRFLPEWCREELMEQNERLIAANNDLRQENERLKSYIDGVHAALRVGRKITIYNGGDSRERLVCDRKQ